MLTIFFRLLFGFLSVACFMSGHWIWGSIFLFIACFGHITVNGETV